ncbi:MAG: DUF4258 domain-containing protein [Dehalococcoidia bacterium]
MSDLLGTVVSLVANRDVRISSHGYDELASDGILVRDIISCVRDAKLIEEYPEYPKGPCVLVLQYDNDEMPVHVVWGIPKGSESPAVLVTAYRPDPERWEDGFLRRR